MTNLKSQFESINDNDPGVLNSCTMDDDCPLTKSHMHPTGGVDYDGSFYFNPFPSECE